MNCDELRHLAPLYLSGELAPQQRQSCDLHLQSCRECKEILEQQRACDARLVAILGNEMPNHSQIDRVNRYIREHIAAPPRSCKQRWLVPCAIAASLIAGIVCAYAWMTSFAVPPSYTAAAQDHWAEVVEHEPRHWRSTPAEIQSLIAASGLSSHQVAALAPTGYWLQRAKLCGIAGRRTLHFVFSNGPQQYSLYVRSHRGAKESVRLFQHNTEEVAGFETGRFSALVVTIGTPTQCAEIARLAAARL
jgi:anti-sigma factor RsiW